MDNKIKKRIIKNYDAPSLKRIEILAGLIKGKIILDIGCRDSILKRYMSGSIKYWGLDIKPSESQIIEGDIVTGDICKNSTLKLFKNIFFDTVVLGETLEHLYDPIRALKNIKLLLKKGGLLVGSVPNALSWKQFFFSYFINEALYKSFKFDPNFHLCSFTPDILYNQLSFAGYKVVSIKEWGNWIPHTNFLFPFGVRGAHLIFIAEKN